MSGHGDLLFLLLTFSYVLRVAFWTGRDDFRHRKSTSYNILALNTRERKEFFIDFLHLLPMYPG